MRTKVYSAGVVLGATLAAAMWVYTYRTWSVVEYIDRSGRHFRASERIQVQPWWSVPATLALVLTGLGVNLWLLPEGRRIIERFTTHFGKGDPELG